MVVETNDTEYVVVWIKGAVYDPNTSRPAPKPKTKTTPILPEKLVGKTADTDFAPELPIQKFPEFLMHLSTQNLSREPIFAHSLHRLAHSDSLVRFLE
jgi:hypothetical protein